MTFYLRSDCFSCNFEFISYNSYFFFLPENFHLCFFFCLVAETSIVFKINNQKVSWKTNQHIRMISEGLYCKIWTLNCIKTELWDKKSIVFFYFCSGNKEEKRKDNSDFTSHKSDTEDWSKDAENSALHHRNKLHCNYISQYYCFYCIFGQINAALATPNRWTVV